MGSQGCILIIVLQVHNNWIVGHDNKVITFKRWRLWFPDLAPGERPTPRMSEKAIEAGKGLHWQKKTDMIIED